MKMLWKYSKARVGMFHSDLEWILILSERMFQSIRVDIRFRWWNVRNLAFNFESHGNSQWGVHQTVLFITMRPLRF